MNWWCTTCHSYKHVTVWKIQDTKQYGHSIIDTGLHTLFVHYLFLKYRAVVPAWPLYFSSTDARTNSASLLQQNADAMWSNGLQRASGSLMELNVGNGYARVGSPTTRSEGRVWISRSNVHQHRSTQVSDFRLYRTFPRIRLPSLARFPMGKGWSVKNKKVCDWELFPKTSLFLTKKV